MGSFSADTSKPYAWFSGKRKIIFIQPKTSQPTTARNSADSSAAGSPLLAFNPFDGSDSEDSGESLGGMLLSSPATVMMSGLLDGTGSQPNGQFVDPVEAFFPGISEQDDEALYDDDMDSDEDQIDINDLIQFPGESDDNSDSEDAIKTDPPLPQAAADETSNGQSLSNGSRNRNNNHFESRSESLLKHFDRGPVVSSFRRNQTRHQSLLRKPSFGASALYGIRGGRHAFANNPISPLRRRKGSLGSGKTQLLHKIATKRIDLAGRIRKRTNTF